MGFALDPAFADGAIALGDLPLSHVLMQDDARFPWLILVPRRPAVAEIIELEPQDRALLMDEIVAASSALKTLYGPDKLNVGALGNHVRQLHVHVIARFASDPAWPGPVWGHSPAVPYPAHVAGMTADRVAKALKPHGLKEIHS
jgi:diadenosine tetraphosphate (Ap4A) HIT family hydrolase